MLSGGSNRAIGHDILGFCERELVTLRGGGIEKKMAIIVLVKARWNHHNMSDFQCMFSAKSVLSLASFIEYDGGPENCVKVPKKEVLPPQKMGKMTRCGDKMETWILREKPPFSGLISAPPISIKTGLDLLHTNPVCLPFEPINLRYHNPIRDPNIVYHSRPEGAYFETTANTKVRTSVSHWQWRVWGSTFTGPMGRCLPSYGMQKMQIWLGLQNPNYFLMFRIG